MSVKSNIAAAIIAADMANEEPEAVALAKKNTSPRPSPQSGEGEKLELVTQADAKTEKAIDANVKTMRLAVNGVRRSESLLYAYAAICGAAANRLAVIMPHGGLEKVLAEKFPDVSKSQLHVWRQFADDLMPLLVKTKCPTVGLLTTPNLGKKMALPEKKLEGFQSEVKKVLRGATMRDFHAASSFCGETQAAGGKRGSGPPHKISDEDAAELQREQVRANAAEAARILTEKEPLIRLMDDMAEFTKLRLIYHDLNQAMLEMGKKANTSPRKRAEGDESKKEAA